MENETRFAAEKDALVSGWLGSYLLARDAYDRDVEAGDGDPSDEAQNEYDEAMERLAESAAEIFRRWLRS